MRIEPELGAANENVQVENEEYLLNIINDLPQLELPNILNWDDIYEILNHDNQEEVTDDDSSEGEYDLQMDPINEVNQMNVDEVIDIIFGYLYTLDDDIHE